MKYILLLGILVSFSGTNFNAQSTKNSHKPKIKMVKEVLYKVENGELKSRDNLFESNLDSYTIYDKNEKPIEFGRFGDFVANIPGPLGIGKVETQNGRWLPGFSCENYAIETAEEISDLGGWRQYLSGDES